MTRIVLDIPDYLAFDEADLPAVFALLAKGKVMKRQGYSWDATTAFTPSEKIIEIRLMPETAFLQPQEPGNVS